MLLRVSWHFQLEACKERTTQQPSCHSSGFHQFEAIDHFYVCPGNLYGWPENLVDLDPDRDYMILIFVWSHAFWILLKWPFAVGLGIALSIVWAEQSFIITFVTQLEVFRYFYHQLDWCLYLFIGSSFMSAVAQLRQWGKGGTSHSEHPLPSF